MSFSINCYAMENNSNLFDIRVIYLIRILEQEIFNQTRVFLFHGFDLNFIFAPLLEKLHT